ncbi:MAG: HPr family phosphocarrier protein [Bacillota bacterium]
MLQKKLVIPTEHGLHARPASILVNKASQFECEIKIILNGKDANAKSILAVTSLGAIKNDEIIIETSGSDEKEALDEISEMIINLT